MKQLFAVFGNPVAHSKSPLIHNYTLQQLEIDGVYTRYHLKDGHLLRSLFLDLGLHGANVTVPYKEAALEACDEVEPFAKQAGVVNTIVKKEGKLYGYNTDASGFYNTISHLNNSHKILFIGAGGTAQSTALFLQNKGYDVSILNRSTPRLEYFVTHGFKTYLPESLHVFDFDIIVNMTSAGLNDASLPTDLEILNKIIPNSKLCIDVIYGKITPFLGLASQYNKPTVDGVAMLVNQGALAFDIFTNHKHNLDTITSLMHYAIKL